MKTAKEFALTPEAPESAYVKYRLELANTTSTQVADSLNVEKSLVANVIAGRRHSARIERYIAQVTGFPSWNALIETAQKEAV